MPSVTISARRLRRYEAAENVARAFRKMVTQNAPGDIALDWLLYWLAFSEREHGRPLEVPPVPARWKYNRDQAAHGWPDKRKGGSR